MKNYFSRIEAKTERNHELYEQQSGVNENNESAVKLDLNFFLLFHLVLSLITEQRQKLQSYLLTS